MARQHPPAPSRLRLTSFTACALPPSILMSLPTGHYMLGAALSVLLTAALAMAVPHLPDLRARKLTALPVARLAAGISHLSFIVFVCLCLIGGLGPRDPMHNLMTLVFWTGVWVLIPLLAMVFGDLWRVLNPWTAPIAILHRLLGRPKPLGLTRFAQWPAVAGLLAFSWFQIVSLSPEDPWVLTQLAVIYWAGYLVLGFFEGEDWLREGEMFSLYFNLLSRISPLWVASPRATLYAGPPGTQILSMPPLGASGIAFVTAALAMLSFDGLRATFWWLALIGQNPLEFYGRSAVMVENTLGLLAAWGLTFLAIVGAILAGERLAGRKIAKGPVMLSFLAIAAGYHFAHYLMTLLTAGQFTIAALNDPLYLGASYLDLPPYYVSMGFLTDERVIKTVWNLQFAAILGAHMLAVFLALKLDHQGQKSLAHLPLSLLMVLYTVFGLWLLASPTGI